MNNHSEQSTASAGALSSSRAAGIAAAIFTVLLFFGGIGYAAWVEFGGPRQEDLTEIQPSIAQRIAAGAGGNPRRPAEMIRATKNGLIANAGEIHLDATHPNKDKPWRLVVSYNRGDLVTPQQNAALTARFRLPIDAAFAKSLNVTPDQIKQLGAIEAGTNPIMPLTDDERAKLASLAQAYVDAGDKAAPQAALLKQLQALGPAKLAATKQGVADRAAAIEKILSSDQIKAFLPK